MSPKLIPYDEAGYLMSVAIEKNDDDEQLTSSKRDYLIKEMHRLKELE